MSISIAPLYGAGPAPVIPSRRSHTADLFGGVSDEEARIQFNIRCRAIQDFLNGARNGPEVEPHELCFGTSLGGDDFDKSIDSRSNRRY